jgi:hypothetical protein
VRGTQYSSTGYRKGGPLVETATRYRAERKHKKTWQKVATYPTLKGALSIALIGDAISGAQRSSRTRLRKYGNPCELLLGLLKIDDNPYLKNTRERLVPHV